LEVQRRISPANVARTALHGGYVISPFEHAEQLHTNELAVAQEFVSRSLFGHEVHLLHPGSRLDAWMWADGLRYVSVLEICYGADVTVVPVQPASRYILVIPRNGSCVVRCGGEQVTVADDRGAVFGVRSTPSLRWSEGCALRVVAVEATALATRLRDMLGYPPRAPLRFELGVNVSSGHGRLLAEDVDMFVTRLEHHREIFTSPLAAGAAVEALMTSVLLATRHNYRESLVREPDGVSSTIVRATVDMIQEHPDWDHSLDSLAREQRVSTRTLGRLFKREKGLGPIAYLKQVRLDRVHAILRNASPDTTTVGRVAQVMGFANRAHFAAEYRSRHGELPSETLRR
jgi:AraC-like DNA-binding protein